MSNFMRLLFGLGFALVGIYHGLNVIGVSPEGAIQQAVAACWGLETITAFGFAGLLLSSISHKK